MSLEVQKLRDLARSWGGDILEVTSKGFKKIQERPDFFHAPFTNRKLGVDWRRRYIIGVDLYWPEVIHEMGHAFTTLDDPNSSDEFDFFGWEYQLAKFIGADVGEWCESNESYQIEQFGDFGGLNSKDRRMVLQERVRRAKELSIVDKQGRPMAVPRTLNIEKLKTMLEETAKRFADRATAKKNARALSGREFEELWEAEGFSQGYKQGIEDALRVLKAMV